MTRVDPTAEAAENLVAARVPIALQWIYRRQLTSDVGVDGQIEIVQNGEPSGRLLGIQVKGGPSWFKEPTPDGWIYRPSEAHYAYWSQYALPMLLLLVDLSDEQIYWQHLTPTTMGRLGPRGGLQVLVPRSNLLQTAGPLLNAIAEADTEHAHERFVENLGLVPHSTSRLIRKLHLSRSDLAVLLAAYLATGRAKPRETARLLLDASESWLASSKLDSYEIIATYASNHDIDDLASEAFLKRSEASDHGRGQFLALAAAHKLSTTPHDALTMFEEATRAADDPVLGQIGVVLANHSLQGSRRLETPTQLASRLAEEPPSLAGSVFMAQVAESADDTEAALTHWEDAVRLDEDLGETHIRLSRALLRRGATGSRRLDDNLRAIQIAETALAARRLWGCPTAEYVSALVTALSVSERWHDVIQVGTEPPDGRASEDEASIPTVQRHTMLAALALADSALVERLESNLTDDVDRAYAQALKATHDNEEEDPDRQRTIWLQVAETLGPDRPQQLVNAVGQLARLGLDKSALLAPLITRHVLPGEHADLISAIAGACASPAAGLPQLRLAALQHPMAAEVMIDLLKKQGNLSAALDACRAGAVRFRNAYFSLEAAALCLRQDPPLAEEARRNAASVASSIDSSPQQKIRAFGLLGSLAADEGQFPDAERYFEQQLALTASKPSSETCWNLALVQLRQGDIQRAWRTVQEYRPEIVDERSARLWAQLALTQPPTPAIASQFLSLADQFADDPELNFSFLSVVITQTRSSEDPPASELDSRPVIGDDLRIRAYQALEDHIDRFGERALARRLRAESPTQLVSQISQVLNETDRQEPLRQIAAEISGGRMPLGLLAKFSGRSYGLVLAMRGCGHYCAASTIDGEIDLGRQAFRAACGSPIVVDASAVQVASLLESFDVIRSQFSRVLVPSATMIDLRRSRIEISNLAASSGTLGLDQRTGLPLIVENQVDLHAAAFRRLDLMQSKLGLAESMQLSGTPLIPGFSLEEDGAWLGCIELASRENLVAWIDDVALARIARELGVQVFSTADALEELRDRRIENAKEPEIAEIVEQSRASSIKALQERVVDIPYSLAELEEVGEFEVFAADLAASTVGREAFWVWSENPWRDLQHLINTVARIDPRSAAEWRLAAMHGVARLGGNRDFRSLMLAAALIVPVEAAPDTFRVELTTAADRIASENGLAEPRALISQAAVELHGLGLVADAEALAHLHLRDGDPDLS